MLRSKHSLCEGERKLGQEPKTWLHGSDYFRPMIVTSISLSFPFASIQVQSANVLFIDQPVGTGYSYVDNPTAYTTDIEEISDDLLVMLSVFLSENTEFQVKELNLCASR